VKTAVVTLHFGEREYFATHRNALEAYCHFHGYKLRVDTGEVFRDGRDLRWSKVGAIISAFMTGVDRVLYLDGDALPVNPTRPVSVLEGLLGDADLLVGQDPHGKANTGALLARRSSADILAHWHAVPDHEPETRNTWPVDELGFNDHTLPAFRSRIALCRGQGTDADFLRGTFVHHFCNGTPSRKAELLRQLVAKWP
jgi:hypothetical protein